MSCTLIHQPAMAGLSVLALAGSVDGESLPEIDRFIRNSRKAHLKIAIDLSDVTLLDRAAAQFFARLRSQGVALLNCPVYIEPWISREAKYEKIS